jgi:glycosyltransferase involved in cell wall biosynthesis
MNIFFGCMEGEKNGFCYLETLVEELAGYLSKKEPGHRFFILSPPSPHPEKISKPGVERIFLKNPGHTNRLKKIGWQLITPSLLKKNQADVFISFDGQTIKFSSVPQVLVLPENKKISKAGFKKASRIIVCSQWQKAELLKKYPETDKTDIISPALPEKIVQDPGPGNQKINVPFPFFHYSGLTGKSDSLINILKSFSQFKKRQKSSLKLVFFSEAGDNQKKLISAYKYRDDVIFVNNPGDEAGYLPSSYAAIIDPLHVCPVQAALTMMTTGVPVIAFRNAALQELPQASILLMENNSETALIEKMNLIYTDEKLRNQLIQNGREVSREFTVSRMADGLWQSISRAVK